MARLPPALSDPRVLVSAGMAGVVTGLVVGGAVAAAHDRPEGAGPPAVLRMAITSPLLRPRLAPEFSLAVFGLAPPKPAARDLQCLTEAVYYEARGESEEGQAAVAQVVMNRTHKSGFPKSVCGVVFQRTGPGCQFSFACDASVTSRREPAAWDRARRVATRVLGGEVVSEVGRATHYHVAGLQTGWIGLSQVARIGAHVFYALSGRHAPSAPAGSASPVLAARAEPAPAEADADPATAEPAPAATPTPAATLAAKPEPAAAAVPAS